MAMKGSLQDLPVQTPKIKQGLKETYLWIFNEISKKKFASKKFTI